MNLEFIPTPLWKIYHTLTLSAAKPRRSIMYNPFNYVDNHTLRLKSLSRRGSVGHTWEHQENSDKVQEILNAGTYLILQRKNMVNWG